MSDADRKNAEREAADLRNRFDEFGKSLPNVPLADLTPEQLAELQAMVDDAESVLNRLDPPIDGARA